MKNLRLIKLKLRNRFSRIRSLFRERLAGNPVQSEGALLSRIYPMDGNVHQITSGLFDSVIDAVALCRSLDLSAISGRIPPTMPNWVDIWPGEHYRLLAGLASKLQPSVVVEIGTFTGLSALVLKQYSAAQVHTFDIVPWSKINGTCLTQEDFGDGRLIQHLADLSDPEQFSRHSQLLEKADLLFIDGPKDGVFEYLFFEQLAKLTCKADLVVIVDDIRVWTMLRLWKKLERRKLDLTSFGHWSGTGLIEW